jgi:minimal PKS chain-length factor (CLF/KS beta)
MKRAVVTGIGVVAPTGIGTSTYWEATKQGKSGIRRITLFDPSSYATQFAGEVPDFDATKYIDQRLIVQTDRWTWMAMAAAQMALKDSGVDLTKENPSKLSVITASSSGGNEFGQKEISSLWAKGPLFVGAYQSIAWFYAATTGQIAIKHVMKGPCGVMISEGAGGLDAIAHSRRNIRRGTDVAVSGGLEAPIGPYALACQLKNGLLSPSKDADGYRPFDARANGYVPGEGGAILLLEELEHARKRGARIYGEIAGCAATHDGYHHHKPAPDARSFSRAMSLALKDAQVTPDQVDVVFADGAGTREGDALESKAIREVFGTRAASVPVTVPKSMVGRLYAGGASLDVATALLAMQDGLVPPTIGLEKPAPGCELDFVTGKSRAMKVDTVLVNARGYGGFNSAMVLRKLA